MNEEMAREMIGGLGSSLRDYIRLQRTPIRPVTGEFDNNEEDKHMVVAGMVPFDWLEDEEGDDDPMATAAAALAGILERLQEGEICCPICQERGCFTARRSHDPRVILFGCVNCTYIALGSTVNKKDVPSEDSVLRISCKGDRGG